MQAFKGKSKGAQQKILIICAVLVLLGSSFFLYKKYHHDDPSTAVSGLGEEIDMSPPTQQEKDDVDKHKEDLAEQPQQNAPSSGRNTVTPSISDAGLYDKQIEVRGFIADIFEGGGTCRVELTMGSQKVTKEIAATQGTSTTICPLVKIPMSELSTGNWTVKLSYSSPNAEGISDARSVEVK
jgi:hypothetical protein